MTTGTRTPVLIVGAGLTGLSAAVFLARQGVASTVVERHTETSIDPKARVMNPRTAELYRAAGVERAIRAVRSPIAGHTVVAHAATVAGPERRRLPSGVGEDCGHLTPCRWLTIDQNQVEPVLREHAARAGVDLRFGVELVAVREDRDGATAVLREGTDGREHTVTAEYLIAADGARGPIRAMLGIPHHGPGALTRLVSVYFQADLREPLRDRAIIALILRNPAVHGTLTPLDGEKRWRFSFLIADGETPADYPETRCVALVKAAVGVADLPVVVERVSDTPWEIAGRVAERMRAGRVFLAGDAAHVMPPIGAFGAGTGVQDAYNLSWKIPLVRRGVAGPALLDTYELERLPVGEETTRQAIRHYEIGHGRRRGEDTVTALRTAVFGYVYRDGAFVADPFGASEWLEDPEHPSARPGARAPHVVVESDGTLLSTVDFLGSFALFAGPLADGWARAAAEVTARSGLALDCRRIGDDLRDVFGCFPDRYGIGPAGAVLVRPDGFVAWRSPIPVAREDQVETLTRVLDVVLCRGTS